MHELRRFEATHVCGKTLMVLAVGNDYDGWEVLPGDSFANDPGWTVDFEFFEPICQAFIYADRSLLTCPKRERNGFGYQCERMDPHDENGHWFSDHLIRHSRMGNGYHCAAFEDRHLRWKDRSNESRS